MFFIVSPGDLLGTLAHFITWAVLVAVLIAPINLKGNDRRHSPINRQIRPELCTIFLDSRKYTFFVRIAVRQGKNQLGYFVQKVVLTSRRSSCAILLLHIVPQNIYSVRRLFIVDFYLHLLLCLLAEVFKIEQLVQHKLLELLQFWNCSVRSSTLSKVYLCLWSKLNTPAFFNTGSLSGSHFSA